MKVSVEFLSARQLVGEEVRTVPVKVPCEMGMKMLHQMSITVPETTSLATMRAQVRVTFWPLYQKLSRDTIPPHGKDEDVILYADGKECRFDKDLELALRTNLPLSASFKGRALIIDSAKMIPSSFVSFPAAYGKRTVMPLYRSPKIAPLILAMAVAALVASHGLIAPKALL